MTDDILEDLLHCGHNTQVILMLALEQSLQYTEAAQSVGTPCSWARI